MHRWTIYRMNYRAFICVTYVIQNQLILLYNINNDLVEGDSAYCQPKETLLTEVLAD